MFCVRLDITNLCTNIVVGVIPFPYKCKTATKLRQYEEINICFQKGGLLGLITEPHKYVIQNCLRSGSSPFSRSYSFIHLQATSI